MMLKAALMALPMFGAAFAQGVPALAGTWFVMRGQAVYNGFPDEKLQLSANGTGTFDGSPLKWKAENGRITLTLPNHEREYEYKYAVSGATLILTSEDNRKNVQYSKTAKQQAAFLNKTTFAAVSVNTGSENKEPKAVISADGDKPVVYVSGRYNDENSNSRACYWKDGIRTDLHLAEEKESEANAIAVAAGSVYVAGSYDAVNVGGIADKRACYWKDGVRTDLHHDDLLRENIFYGTTTSQTNAITVAGNTAYVAGYYSGSYFAACYWKADAKEITRTILYKQPDSPNPYFRGSPSEGMGIAVLGNTVYTSGYHTASNSRIIACYWKDDKRTNLPTTSVGHIMPKAAREDYYAGGIAISGNSVYISGHYEYDASGSRSFQNQACYWKDGVQTLLDDGDDAKVHGIAVSGNTVYTAGFYRGGGACYWEGTTRKYLDVPQNAAHSVANAITVFENTVYIAGYYDQGEGAQSKRIPCYWIDGKRIDLPAPAGTKKYGAMAMATGIAVNGGKK